MAFGLGERYAKVLQGEPARKQVEIACSCWFTSQGRTMPQMIKFMNENGEIQTIKDIKVNHVEEKRYSGITSVEYDCDIEVGGQLRRVRLVFYIEKCRWAMCL